jgi:hypothetical protein
VFRNVFGCFNVKKRKEDVMKRAFLTMLLVVVVSVVAHAEMLLDVNGDATIHASGLWHFDGNMDDALGSGSTSAHWYGYNWADAAGTHSGGSALDLTDTLHGMQYINLAGDAQINGSNGFGIAMWVKRTGTSGYPAIFGFGSDSLFKMSEHSWYLGSGILLPQNSGMTTPPAGSGGNTLPDAATNAWSFISVNTFDDQGQRYVRYYSANANGVTTGNAVYAVGAAEVLNASNTIWLGGVGADLRSSMCYIDELVISNQACGSDWAASICAATKGGVALVPEPATIMMMIAGCGCLIRRKPNA